MTLPTAHPGVSLNPMSFTENQHGNVVLERLRKQRETGRFCDVVLVVQGRQFPAHRNILAACSPYFDSILRMHKVVKEQVTVNCQNSDAFELLLNYMYSGSVVIDRNSVMELLKLSNNFLVTKLKNYCAEYLDRYLDAANCLTVKDLAEKYNMPGLVKNVCLYLEANSNRCLLESIDAVNYPLLRIESLLSDQNYEFSSSVHLKFIVRWVGHKIAERETSFKQLLSALPLAAVGRDVLTQLLDMEPLFHNSEQCRFALLQAMYENSISLHKYEAQYQALLAKYSGEVNMYFNTNSNSPMDESAFNPSPLSNDQQPAESKMPSFASEQPILTPETSFDRQTPTETERSVSTEKQRNVVLAPGETDISEPISYIPIVVPVIKQEVFDLSINENFDPPPPTDSSNEQIDTPGDMDNGPISGPTENENRPVTDEMTQMQPVVRQPLKMTIKLPLINRKHRLLGKHKLYRKQVGAANNCLLKKRGRPPKFRVVHSGGDDWMGDSGAEDRGDSGGLVVDEGKGARAECLFKCPHCVYTSNCQSRIQSHIEKAHNRSRIFYCNVCNFECKWNREFYMHMKQHFQGPPFRCDTCDYAAERIQMLLTHRMKHTDERPHQCTQCEYRCRTKTNLVAHMRSHTGEKPFSCTECGRGFSIKSTLDQHLATHSDTRPFRCEQCSFSTKYQSHLISHKRIHTGDVFHCQFPDCTYSSPKKSQLAAHLRTHLAVRAHSCKICNRAFIEKSHLVRHERIHLAEKPFKCGECDYASSRRDKLKEHIQKHHGAAGMRQRQRRRRVKQLGLIPKTTTVTASPDQGRLMLNPAAGFRPITPAENGHPVSDHRCGSMFANPLLSPSPLLQRPSSAIFPAAGGSSHTMQPSPALSALSLNFNLGYETPVVSGNKDVLLSTQVAPTPTLVTPTPRSPQSSANSLQSDPFPHTNTPTDGLQRPMSLPPLGQNPGVWPQQDFSFTAMF